MYDSSLRYSSHIYFLNNFSLRKTISLTFLCPSSLLYRNQSIDLLCRSMGWLLYDRGLCHERVILVFYKNIFIRTKAMILAKKKLEISYEQSQVCCPTEHKKNVSRTRHENKLRCICYFSPVIFD